MFKISLDKKTGIPMYKQIILAIERAITEGVLIKGDKLPSINTIKNEHSLSRDTVLFAFNELKARGIIRSVVGKGYYVNSENITITKKIFLLFDELNAFKEDLYNAFLSNLGDNIQVDIFFHHFNYDVFSKLIFDNIGGYTHYIIMPANLKNPDVVISKLPSNKVYILDQTSDKLSQYTSIYQNFEKDISTNLNKGLHLIQKYDKIIFLFPEKEPIGLRNGFNLFCEQHSITNELCHSIKDRVLKSGEVYIIPDDRNLILIIKNIKESGLIIGKDIGIISYNDTLLKEIVEGGITTISTDFKQMGKRLAEMVINKEHKQIANPSHFILRNSL